MFLMGGQWKFQVKGGGVSKILNEHMELNWNFLRGGVVQTKKLKLSVGGGGGCSMDIFWYNRF